MPEALITRNPRTIPAVGRLHVAITPSDTNLTDRPLGLKVTVAGNLSLKDELGTVIVYPVTAGEEFSFSPVAVMAATTATVVAWY